MRLVPLALAATLGLLIRPAPADACSLPPPVQLEDPYAGLVLDGVPAAGPLALLAQNYLDFATAEDIDAVAFTVLDASGAEIPGATEVTDTRVLWRPAAPLDPLATYTATLELGWFSPPAELTFTTAAAGADFTPVAEPDQIAFREEARATAHICCELEFPDSCGGTTECGATAIAIHPVLRLGFVGPELRRYQDLSVTSAGKVESAYYNMGFPVVFDGGATYCAQVTATSIIDGSRVTTDVCADPADLVPADGDFTPFECDGPEVDPDTGEPIDDAGGGCAAGGGAGGAGLLLVILAAALARRRWQLI